MNRLLVSWFSVGLMLILFQSLAECSLSKNVTLKEGQTFNLECSSGNRSDWWITYNGTRIQVAACIAHISKCIYQIISDNDNYRASYYKPNGYVSDSNTTSTTSYFQVLHVQHGLTKIECSNDVSSVSWDVTVVGVTLTVNGETSDVVSTCDSTTVTVSCQYEGQSKSTLSLLWRSFNDEMIVLAGTLGNKLTYTLPQEFTARHYSLFTNWIECSLRGAVDVTTKVRLVIDA
ncbi:hypothetical protein Bpfe_009258, partial [Biomphalaria pfeifferi]